MKSLLACWILLAAAAPAADPLAPLRAAARGYTAGMKGVVACRVQGDTTIRSTVWNKAYRATSWQLHQDGKAVRALFEALAIDGKPASEQERRELEDKTNQGMAADPGFRAPYDAPFLGDYELVRKGPRAFGFTSKVRDDKHGDGVLYLDGQGRLDHADYAIAKARGNATAHVAVAFGPVGPDGATAIRTLSVSAKGSVGPLSGSMSLSQALAGYRRFASLDAAAAAAKGHR